MYRILLTIIAIVAASATLFANKPPGGAPGQFPPSRLAGVKSWGYQLQRTEPAEVARSPYDVIVMDFSRDGGISGIYGRHEIEQMKRKPGGGRRYVLAYMSVGEAEDYRSYWDNDWVETLKLARDRAPGLRRNGFQPPPMARSLGIAPPAGTGPAATSQAETPPKPQILRVPRLSAPTWLGRESEAWSGNFAVRYWDPDWQKILFGTPTSYLERIIAAGFDGIYIDRVDAYYSLIYQRPSAEQEMADFVIRLARHARSIKPDFIVVPQNAEELLLNKEYLAEIDAIGKEDLLYGGHPDGLPNPALQVRATLGWLGAAKAAKRPVLVIEYLDDMKLIKTIQKTFSRHGFIGYFGNRALDALILPDAWMPAAASGTGRPAGATGSNAAPNPQ